MIHLARRLARGSGRGELVRALLVGLGAALATVLLLSAALVTAISGGDCRPGCTRGSLYRTELLDQAGLRPGVVTALVLMCVPVLVFLGMCARISAAQRDRRLAAIRLAGGTPAQVRALAAADTGLPAAAGALVGLAIFAVVRQLLERRYLDGLGSAVDRVSAEVPGGLSYAEALLAVPARALPTDLALPVGRSLLVLLLVPALCAASAVLALRQVETTPLGVSRRSRPRPRPRSLALLAVGLLLLLVAPVVGDRLLLPGPAVIPLLAIGAGLVLFSVPGCGSWLTGVTGTLAARWTGRPAVLLAARRLQADPHAQGRALSGVVMALLVASGASVLESATLQQLALEGGQRDDSFFRSAYDLVDLALLVSLVVAAAGLLVASCEAVLERRRTLASLTAAGVPLGTLRSAVLVQSLLPALPAVLLATVIGTAAGQLFAGSLVGPTIPWLRLLAIVALALSAVLVAAVLTLPLLHRSTTPAELRHL